MNVSIIAFAADFFMLCCGCLSSCCVSGWDKWKKCCQVQFVCFFVLYNITFLFGCKFVFYHYSRITTVCGTFNLNFNKFQVLCMLLWNQIINTHWKRFFEENWIFCYYYLSVRSRLFLWLSVQLEIDERREFLRDMEGAGQGEKFRPIIETQISQVSLWHKFWWVLSMYLEWNESDLYHLYEICKIFAIWHIKQFWMVSSSTVLGSYFLHKEFN